MSRRSRHHLKDRPNRTYWSTEVLSDEGYNLLQTIKANITKLMVNMPGFGDSVAQVDEGYEAVPTSDTESNESEMSSDSITDGKAS